MTKVRDLSNLFLAESVRHMCDVSVGRIRKCLATVNEEEIWRRPNASTVSIGNLVLHLCGNVRQYIMSGMGGAADTRSRDDEFGETGPVPRATLVQKLDQILSEAREVLDKLTEDDLLGSKTIQGFDLNGLGAILHVVEHFSYHTGQIGFAVKLLKDQDLKYYEGYDLNAKNQD